MKRPRTLLALSGLLLLIIATAFFVRTWNGSHFRAALVDVNGRPFSIVTLDPANPTLTLAPGQHTIVTIPTTGLPIDMRWARPSDFSGAQLKVYEFTENFAQEKLKNWSGRHYNYGPTANALQDFLPGRTYYIIATQSYVADFQRPIGGGINTYDIALYHDESPTKFFGPATTDMARGDLFRQAVGEMQYGDVLEVGSGRFDIDCKNKGVITFPDYITVVGQGMSGTLIYADCYSDAQGSAFNIRNGNFSDLSFENNSWQIFEDGRTIEMYSGEARTPDNVNILHDSGGAVVIADPAPGPYTANLDRVRIIGTAWAVYNWSNRGHTWNIRDSEIVSGRQGVSMMSSSGELSQRANIIRTKFFIDTMRSRDIGWTSRGNPPVGGGYGVLARSGHVTVEDSEFHMKCGDSPHPSSFVPRCVGVFDGNGFGSISSQWTFITLNNNRWYIDGDFYGPESVDTYDILMTQPDVISRLIVNGGCGSGSGCAITKNW